MEKTKYHTTCLNKVEAVSYTYWDECNKCKNGMWPCGRDCETEKTGVKYICKFCSDENISHWKTCDKEEKKKIEEDKFRSIKRRKAPRKRAPHWT